MNTAIALEPTAAAPAAQSHSTLRILLLESKLEILRLVRYAGFSVPTLSFPLMFYILFGVVFAGQNDPDAARHVLVSYGVFGVMAPGLFAFGVTLAFERERGLLQLKRALPVPPGVYLGAKLATALVFAATTSVLMLLLGRFAAHVQFSAVQYVELLATDILGVLPFCAIGLLIGALMPASGAPALVNMIYLPMSFLSGLWVPVWMLPHTLQAIAPVWPSYHLAQIALQIAGSRNDGQLLLHVATLAAVAVFVFREAGRRLAKG